MLMLMLVLLIWRPRTISVEEILPQGVTLYWLHSVAQIFNFWMFLQKLTWIPVPHDSEVCLGAVCSCN